MLAEKDRHTLLAAGIDDPDILAASVAAFLRAHPDYARPALPNALSDAEEDFLRQGGAVGVGESEPGAYLDGVARTASEYAQLVATALTQREAAQRLGVSTSRVRQRLDERSLYAIEASGGRVCPSFQFGDTGTLPGFERVLAAISPRAHPVAVQRFFLGISADLESDHLSQPLSPRDWLLTGHSADPVITLAREL